MIYKDFKLGDVFEYKNLKFMFLENSKDGKNNYLSILIDPLTENKTFTDESFSETPWVNSEIRSYLNGDFLTEYEIDSDLLLDQTTIISPDRRPSTVTCTDKVSLPTCDLIRKYVKTIKFNSPVWTLTPPDDKFLDHLLNHSNPSDWTASYVNVLTPRQGFSIIPCTWSYPAAPILLFDKKLLNESSDFKADY